MARQSLTPTSARRVAMILAPICLVCLCCGAFCGARTLDFLRTAQRVPGTVVGHVYHSGNKGGTWSPVFDFRDKQGVPHSVTSRVSSSPKLFNVGDKVEVLYDPKDINGAETEGFSNWFGAFFFGIFAFVTGLLAVIFLILSFFVSPRGVE